MQKTTPKLSIIVPVYNVEKYLDQCVQSLVNQTLQDIEIILVDDESPDNSPKMCDDYVKADPRFVVVHKKNGGLGYARNTGLEKATGEYVTFIDSDDYIDLKAYDKICTLMDKNHLDELRFLCNRFKNDGSQSPVSYSDDLKIVSDKEQLEFVALSIFDVPNKQYEKYDWGGSSCMAVYRRQVIVVNDLHFFSERQFISEDYLFNFDFYLHCNKVAFLPSTFYHYRINPQSLTRSFKIDALRKAEDYAKYVEASIVRNKIPTKYKIFGMGYYVRALRSILKKMFLMPHVSLAEKKRMFDETCSTDYFAYIKKNYPSTGLPIKQRICHWAIMSKCFLLSYLLIAGFSKIRFNRFK